MMSNTEKAEILIKHLYSAIQIENKKRIMELYEQAKLIDWEEVSVELFEKYDDLVDKGNDLLLN